ncbi:1-deoxy-D-xylulose-5-phosphate synthase [Flavonifractor hominis]|uniref:1-deoxy-D-xylulose-5-phosphate synthase n=1 Tax=Flavonifractor hominis TaxID=3133178 RepID=A0ABV1EN97_9FIRM
MALAISGRKDSGTGGVTILSLDELSDDLSALSDSEAAEVCTLLRARLIDTVSRTGGHLASSLGAVEIIVAIHRVFNTGVDRLVFDVGHQCYAHKILTGRNAAMETLRSFGGIAGFPKPSESACDAFIAGHASNSVSVAVGMARARTLQKKNYQVLALIGDGALSGGLAYEGLSDAGNSGEPLIVILNDNGMSITKSVGGVAEHLAHQRLKPQYLRFKKGYRKAMNVLPLGGHIYRVTHKIKTAVKETLLPCSLFEDMGFTYLGPVDGHDVKGLTRLLRYAKDLQGPVLLHVRTVKGKGYIHAERNPDRFHGVGRFCVETGQPIQPPQRNFSAVFGETLCMLAEQDDRICAITAAMQGGTGLDRFAQRFSERFFDVGIAEGHATAMAAGMAKQGMRPVFAVYSSFLQRAYDMLIHDVALQKLHVVLAVDRAGLVGEDGETHHGVFDAAFLDTVPGMTVLCPSSFAELRRMIRQAFYELDGPVAIRYARGGEGEYREDSGPMGSVCLRSGDDLTLVSYGMMINPVLECARRLEEEGIQSDIVKLNTITPLEMEPILRSVRKTGRLLVAEDVIEANCVGQRIAAAILQAGISLRSMELVNLGRRFVTHGTVPQLQKLCGLDGMSLREKAKEVCSRGER